MNATRSAANAGVSHRPAMPVRVHSFRIRRTGIARAFDGAQTNNGWLIPCGHRDGESPVPMAVRRRSCTMPLRRCRQSRFRTWRRRCYVGALNAFFAISVNSPSMSMVKFCCCVCSAPNMRAWRDPKNNPSADACGSSNESWGPC